jgi:hypothetical protein
MCIVLLNLSYIGKDIESINESGKLSHWLSQKLLLYPLSNELKSMIEERVKKLVSLKNFLVEYGEI